MGIQKAVADRIVALCDGLDMSIVEFFDTEIFRGLEQKIRESAGSIAERQEGAKKQHIRP